MTNVNSLATDAWVAVIYITIPTARAEINPYYSSTAWWPIIVWKVYNLLAAATIETIVTVPDIYPQSKRNSYVIPTTATLRISFVGERNRQNKDKCGV